MFSTNLWKRFVLVALAFVFASAMMACQEVTTITTNLPTPDSVGHFENYDQLKAYLSSYYEKTNDGVYYFRNGGDWALAEADGAITTTMASTPSQNDDSSTDAPSHSETNNQVDGVSESDRVITDGFYIYLVSNQHFYIIDAETLAIVYTYQVDNGWMQGLYKTGDKVVLLLSEYNYEETQTEDGVYSYWYSYSYGIRAIVFDVSDVNQVEIVKQMYFDSTYLVDTRMIDGTVYLIMDNYTIYYAYTEDHFVPSYTDSTVGEEALQIPADQIYYMPNDNQSMGYLILASFNVDDEESAHVSAYLGSSYQIYMSLNNLYTVIYRYYYDEELQRYNQLSYILRFQIVDHQLVFQASAIIEGMPLNQFSMDEYDGVFRIATTSYEWTNEGSTITNQMYLLDATSVDGMDTISVLGGLGKPGERIYAVRYNGDAAYVVTFVNTDPLYTLDLSDPENPEIVGELFEEGVSDYLHILTDDLMVGVGRQAVTSPEGWTYFTGVKVALYDTSEEAVSTIETYLVEGEYSWTNAVYDHKAFVTYQPDGADFVYVAIPVSEWYESWYTYSQSEYVFKVSFSGDLELVT
ncbi:MAG: beta-propeller domain-containing protein, partial [Candidatus Izemoplasmatales bacterium]|nr:beta-propeller domain-containing protein [Candidatus Izemoplasmatales bacterium]